MLVILRRIRAVPLLLFIILVLLPSLVENAPPPKPSDGGAPPPQQPPPPPLPGASSTTVDPLCFKSETLIACSGFKDKYPLINNCSAYYQCLGNSRNWRIEICSDGSLFNRFSLQCEVTLDVSFCLNCPLAQSSVSGFTTPTKISLASTPTQFSTTTASTADFGISTTHQSTSITATTQNMSPNNTMVLTPILDFGLPSTTVTSSLIATATGAVTSSLSSTSTGDVTSSLNNITTSAVNKYSESTGEVKSTESILSNKGSAASIGTTELSTAYNISTSFEGVITIDESVVNNTVPSGLSTTSGKVSDRVTPDDRATGNNATTRAVPSLPYQREILFTRKPSNIIMEGDDVIFVCSFIWQTSLGTAQLDKFFWLLNGKEVENTMRIVISQTKSPSPLGYYNSTLRFNHIRSKDSGNLTCCALTSGFLNATNYLYEVLAKPQVVVLPAFTSINDGEFVTLSCVTLLASNSSLLFNSIRLTWLRDERVTLGIQEYLNSSFPQVSVLNMTSSYSVNVTCFLETSFANVTSDIAFINVVQKDGGDTCPPDTASGVDWDRTQKGSSNFRPCPNGGSGIAARLCLGANRWSIPDLDGCISQKFIDLQQKVNGVKEGDSPLGDGNTTNLTEEFADIVISAENWTKSELDLCVEIIADLANIQNGGASRKVLDKAELLQMMKAIDRLLNVTNWIRLEEHLAVSLLKSINLYANIYARRSENDAIFFVFENLVLETDGLMPLHLGASNGTPELQFPSWTKLNQNTQEAKYWAETEDIITVKNHVELVQMRTSPSQSVNFTSSCIRHLGELLPLSESQKNNDSFINSYLISLTVLGLRSTDALDPPIVISAQHLQLNKNMTGRCVFWNFSAPNNGLWMDDGCQTMSSNETHTVCNCSHLTNFAILMSPAPATGMDEVVLSIISMVGCIISVIALVLTIILYISQWKRMKSKRAVVLINLCASLIIANIIFLAGSSQTQSEVGCKVVAALLHYFFLAAFFMMLLEGIMLIIYIIFVFYVLRSSVTICMIVTAWLIPAVIVAISLGVTRTNGYGTKLTCWLSVKENVLWAFVGPALFVILVNFIIIIIVLVRIANAKVRTNLKKKRNKILSVMRNVVILTPLLGVTWIFGVFSVSEKTDAFQYIFAITNSLQGLFIFVLHALCHTKNKASSKEKPNQQRFSRNPIPHIQIPLSEAESQEDLVRTMNAEKQLHGEEEITKHNSFINKVSFGHQLSNQSHMSNGTALTYVSNNSSSNRQSSSTFSPVPEQ